MSEKWSAENCEVGDCNCTLQEAVDELIREYQVRKRCFDRWVKDGRLSATEARDRMLRLGSAIRFMNTDTRPGDSRVTPAQHVPADVPSSGDSTDSGTPF